MTVQIDIGKGFYATIDDADAALVVKRKWRSLRKKSGAVYAVSDSGDKLIYMHREISGPDKQADHRDGDTLNNRRKNLRPATSSQNNLNRRKVPSRSRYKGVSSQRSKWVAEIVCRGRRYRLGTFVTELAAALAYDAKAIELAGEFARTNKMMGLL